MIKVNYDSQAFINQKWGGVSRYYYEISKRINTHKDFSAQIIAPLYFNQYLVENDSCVTGINRPLAK